MADIVIYKGSYQYDAVNIFADSLGRAFEKMGYSVVFIDLTKPDLIETLQKELSTPKKFILSFSCIGFHFNIGDKNLYELLSYPFIALMVDHPGYFLDRFNIKNIIVTCIDRSHVKFMHDYFGDSKKVAFLPHGGCFDESDCNETERPIDILYAGTYFDQNRYLEEINSLPEIPRKLVMEIAETVLGGNYVPDQEALIKVAEKHNIDLSDKEFYRTFLRDVITRTEVYVRSVKRHRLLETLDKSGLNVKIYGNKWPSGIYKNLKPAPAKTFPEILVLMKKSKIVLNSCCYPDGSHERVYSAMLNGAVSLSDYNPYLAENFTDMENIIFYKWLELSALPDKINNVLSENRWQKIAEAGRKTALEKHTWDARALELLKIVDEFSK